MLGILCCQLRRYKIDFYTQLTKGELLKLHAKVESNQHIHQRFRHFLEMPFDMVKK